jgi:hypothetical protein
MRRSRMTKTGDEREELHRQLLSKHEEIAALVAVTFGLGRLEDLTEKQRQELDGEVDQMIESHDEALYEGDTPEEWEALDKRLNATPVGRLLQEYHEISESFQDMLGQDDDDPDED